MSDKFEKKINGYFIDPLIFTQKFPKHCDIHICSGECCYYGVYTDLEEHNKIMAMQERIIRSMDETQPKDPNVWFEEQEEDDDFPSGIAVGTEVHNGKCVFLDKKGFCTLQKIAMEEGEFKWKYKPIYCILFPLVIFEGALTVDDEHLERMHYCSVDKNQISTVFECCKNELLYILGEPGFQELDDYRKEYLQKLIGVESAK